ncbi:cilia- and flagella-associated protein 97-like [Euwallacea fornicatus]|uniref:cilia- and flagella-associated protein 97-like n=1 Tax=Euwallacea fornicatus TaxID=995702 RepID=UPI00338ED095
MSGGSGKLSDALVNNCQTCEKIKFDYKPIEDRSTESNYSSYFDDESSCLTDSLDLQKTVANFDPIRLNLNQIKCEKTIRASSRTQGSVNLPQNKTFSAYKIREIERGNAMLVNKILCHHRRPNQYKMSAACLSKVTSSEINRRRHQEKIIRENEILLKKIQSVKPAIRYP